VIKNWAASNGETLFPRVPFQTTQLNSALTSGVFSFEGAVNKKAKEVMEAYKSAVADFNVVLGRVGRQNPGVYLKREFVVDRAKIQGKELEESVLAEQFIGVINEQRRMREIFNLPRGE
jgi:hypothetical protein